MRKKTPLLAKIATLFAVAMVSLAPSPLQAALIHYSVNYTITDPETIFSSDIAAGDSYSVTFALEDSTLEFYESNTPGDIYTGFAHLISSFSITPNPGNIGSYVPAVSPNSTVLTAYNISGHVQLRFGFGFDSSNTVDYAGTNGPKEAFPTGLLLWFDTPQPYTNSAGLTTPASFYLSTPTSQWVSTLSELRFAAVPYSADFPSTFGTSTITVAPEPGTLALLAVGLLSLLALHHRTRQSHALK